MTRQPVTVSSEFKLSRYIVQERRRGRQRYWWLRGPDGFVDIGQIPGDRRISLELELPPRQYTLGCGPVGHRGIRERFTVGASGLRRRR